jgi:SAM-dependent methyltransferase
MNRQSKFSTWEQAVDWLRAQPDQRDLVLAAYYDDPLIGAATRYWRSDEWQCLKPLLPMARGRALDVGAGRGISSFALAREGFAVTALEPDNSELVGGGAIRKLSKDAGLAIDVVQEFSERLPFDDQVFDLVFARAVLHHTRDLGAACREFFRVLKPGGRLIAIREHVISRDADLPAFLEAHPLHKRYGGENAFLLAQYTRAITSAGFDLHRVVRPLESPINFAPNTLEELRDEIASRVAKVIPGTRPIVRRLLGWGPVWTVAWRGLTLADSRPGRLYSFIADRR